MAHAPPFGQGLIPGNGEWKRLHLPLAQFSEQGIWESSHWYEPMGAFDWKAVERFEIAADYHDLHEIDFYFDQIGVVSPEP